MVVLGPKRKKAGHLMPGHSLGFGNLDLGDFLDLAVADARRADLQTLAPTIDDCADALQVDVPTTLSQIV